MRVADVRKADVCFLQRELISTLVTFEPLIRPPFVFDVDDAIFLGPRGRWTDGIARRARITICGNGFLAEHYERLGPVAVLPTAVDTDRFAPAASPPSGSPVIGWSGSSSGFAYLYRIEQALRQVLARHPGATLRIVADRPPQFTSLPLAQVKFDPWSPATEAAAVQGFSIGLMPLEDSPWARGKCSFKMLTYMAAGVPVVVSPVGMNAEVLALGGCGHGPRTEAEWVDAIDDLLRHPERAAAMGATGRRLAEQHYSLHVVAPRLGALLRQAAAA